MGVDTSRGHKAMDYKEHEKTYELFTKLTVWGTVAVVFLLVSMAVFLV